MTFVAIVGNGPSATGYGPQIDACHVVVRIKNYWTHGGKDAGDKLTAWATYGEEDDGPPTKPQEVWFTQTPEQVMANPAMRTRLTNAIAAARGIPLFWYTHEEWMEATLFLEAEPSTGFVAIQMALRRFPRCRLVIFGFDSTTPDAPNWEDATPFPGGNMSAHPFLREKQAIAAIDGGQWMGRPTAATLTWPNRPKLPET